MIKTCFWFAAEVLFALLFVAAVAFPAVLGYTMAACHDGAFGWAVLLLVVMPIAMPLAGVAAAVAVLAVAFAVQPLHSLARCRALVAWGGAAALATGLAVGLGSAALGLQGRCHFGF